MIENDKFTECLRTICEATEFTEEFKEFSLKAIIVMELCKTYENGRDKKITIEDLNEENNILGFIQEIKPILETMGMKLDLEENLIKPIIFDMYMKIRDEELIEKDIH